MRNLSSAMHEALKRHVPRLAPTEKHVRAAVLIPLLAASDGERLLYTKRSDHVAAHRGQISFPGGKWSEEDADLQVTALRESWEEVGIAPQDVEILGQLDDVVTLTGFVITPFVGRLPTPYPLRPNPGEIARLIEVPIADLLRPQAFHLESRRAPDGRTVSLYSFETQGDLIWGATARITKQFIDILAGETSPLSPELETI